MNPITKLHREAMELASQFEVASIKDCFNSPYELLRQALIKETGAADMLKDNLEAEPSRSVLYRSAASLAYQCGYFDECKRLVAIGLSGNPPEEIADEMRELIVLCD